MNHFTFFTPAENEFPSKIMDKLMPLISELHYLKGEILFSSDKLERNIYIIKQGVARAFINIDGKDITIWFGQENDVIISAQGYIYNKKGYETMEILENSILYRIELKQLTKLFETDIEVCNWGRQIIEKEFVKTEQRLIYNLSLTATERYILLLQEKPDILQRIQLQYIASYLGVSPESLSRIRTNTKHRNKDITTIK